MAEGFRLDVARLSAIFLIALLIAVSAGRCDAQVPSQRVSVVSSDPCHQSQAPVSQCVLITCKVFTLAAAPQPCVLASDDFVAFVPVEKLTSGRLVRPPLPPPRSSMI